MNRLTISLFLLFAACLLTRPILAGEAGKDAKEDWLAAAQAITGKPISPAPAAEPNSVPLPKAPPLPFHTIEGVSGACITPMAYMANPGPPGTIFGKPSASVTYVWAGHKNVEAFVVTETILRRIELGYALDRFGMGTLPHDIRKAAGIDIDRDAVFLHNWNVRAMLIEEGSFGLPLPAVTVGAHFKYNDGVRDVDDKLHGTLKSLGFARSNGTDFTLTASKTFIDPAFKRPLIVTGGLRNSQAAQIGFLGFSDTCATTFEGSAVYLPKDWLAVGYEFRQKENPYGKIRNLVGDEDNWHTVCVGLIHKSMTLCFGYARLGNLANSSGNCAWAVQLKYEF
jgi:hypothetical protein